LQEELESVPGVRVDLMTPGDLPLKIRAEVLVVRVKRIASY
jgi:predicted nucleotidyltransferase